MDSLAPFFLFLMKYVTPTSSVIVIVLCFIACLAYVFYVKKKMQLPNQKRTIESFPGFLSTLGVLGTFLGITLGLCTFDPGNLDKSIPDLLLGLKTAFYTSLAGMIASVVSNNIINKLYDNYDAGMPTNQDEATSRICEAVETMNKQNIKTMQALVQSIEHQTQNQAAFYNTMLNQFNVFNQMDTNISDISNKMETITLLTRSQDNNINVLAGISQQILGQTSLLDDGIKQVLVSINHTNNYLGEQIEISSATASILNETQEETKKLSEVLRGEVNEIETKMTEINNILIAKFDEFSELLKKSNTEALVEVMSRVTQEFQQQMNALISKLVQENFEQLNQSVAKLNSWQQENKIMINDLTQQYNQMAQEFESTSKVLAEVAGHTQQLSGANGTLSKLTQELQKVMIEDTKFTEISTKLADTANLTKDNMVKFDDSTSKLNEWINKQRNFVDGVQVLIKKLEDLGKIRDYNEEFWRDTKSHLEEGVGFIKEGSTQLTKQITEIDKHFYERLSATLAELDTCIQAMIKGKK